MNIYRICKVCDVREVDGILFPIHGRVCNTCKAAKHRQYYKDNKTRINAQQAKHYQEYYRENKESIDAKKKQYYEENKDSIAARHTKYHQEHKEHINAKDREEYRKEVEAKPARPCVDCGNPQAKYARKYCSDCKAKHDRIEAKLGMQRLRKRL
jgi:NMD protein affecting ribosome stability and mRNA decay